MKANRTGRAGFSLIEVMVVLAILAGLMAGVTLIIGEAAKKQEKMRTSGVLNAVAAALELMKAPEKLGGYPRTDAAELVGPGKTGAVGKQLGSMNDKNAGIESVFVCVQLKGVNIHMQELEADGTLANTDSDTAASAVPDMTKTDLFEYVDAWGNPLVYFHSRDYKNPQKFEKYVKPDGTEVQAKPIQGGKMGGYLNPDGYQLFSMGPDGKPNTEDDIVQGQ